jgi:hypothetical protein
MGMMKSTRMMLTVMMKKLEMRMIQKSLASQRNKKYYNDFIERPLKCIERRQYIIPFHTIAEKEI